MPDTKSVTVNVIAITISSFPIFKQVKNPPYIPIKGISMKITRTAADFLSKGHSFKVVGTLSSKDLLTQKDCSEGMLLDGGQDEINYKH